MCKFLFLSLLFFSACTLPAEKEAKKAVKKNNPTVIETHDANTAAKDTVNTAPLPLPAVQQIKKPNGIYRTTIEAGDKIEQTIAFNSDFTYQLQEKYPNKKDSIVITAGNWTPSDGYIWIYKDQVARGRYKWKDNTLQYYIPQLKKSFSMTPLQDAMRNEAWRSKAKEGVIVFGVGNEPFWSVEYTNRDSISFQLADWSHPVKMKTDSSFSTNDSTGYLARNDSAQLRVTVFPHFCSDGMSDFTYRNKVRVVYNHQAYNGCGILYKK